MSDLRFDHIGNAQRFWDLHAREYRYVPAHDRALVWDSRGVFVEDLHDVRGMELAKAVVQDQWDEIASTADQEERKRRVAWALKSGSAGSLRATLELVRGLPGIAVAPEDLDADPDLFNVLNGTLDLRSGQLRAHTPANLLTRQAGVEYDPDAKAPTWERFLERCLPDPEQRGFVQRAAGYSLSGRVSEHVAFLNIGPGANGKSTWANAIRYVMSDYAGVARKDLLTITRHGQHDSSRTVLDGRRFVTASEIDNGTFLSEAEVKELTGGERISARRMYGDPYELTPTWKLWLSANYRPRVRGTDEAMWRRIRLIEWPTVIPPSERDPDLSERLIDEAAGILAWAVEGHHEWRRIGLAEPAGVVVATAAYRESEDLVGRFLVDNDLVVNPSLPDLLTDSHDLGELLERWNADTGEHLGRKTLMTELQRRGVEKAHTNKARRWRFVGPVTGVTDGDGSPGTLPYARTHTHFPEEAS